MERPASYFASIQPDDEEAPRPTPRLPGRRRTNGQRVARTSKTWLVNCGLPPIIDRIAATFGLSPASVVDGLLHHALGEFAAGRLDLAAHARASRSPRYAWTLDVPVAGLQADVADRLERLERLDSDREI